MEQKNVNQWHSAVTIPGMKWNGMRNVNVRLKWLNKQVKTLIFVKRIIIAKYSEM